MGFSDACRNAVNEEFAVMLGEIIAAVTEKVAREKPAVRGDTAWAALLERSLAPVPRCEDGELSYAVKLDLGPDWGDFLPFGQGGPLVFEELLEAAVEGLVYDVSLEVAELRGLVATPHEHAAALGAYITDFLKAPRLYELLSAGTSSILALASVALGLYVEGENGKDTCADTPAHSDSKATCQGFH